MMEELNDKILLEQFRNPQLKEAAFQQLIKKYQQRIYWHIRRMVDDHDDTDDIMQEVFIKVWKGLAQFREDSQLYTWLYRIASNESITFLNKKKNRKTISYDDIKNEIPDNVGITDAIEGNQIQLKLQRAINTLPDKQKLVFNLKYYEEMKYEEMSSILGTSVGALKASYHIAVKKIEEFIITH